MKREIKKIVEIPEEVEVKIEGNFFNVKGPLGEIKSNIKFKKNILVEKKDKKIEVYCKKTSKKEKKIMGTIVSRIENMTQGVMKKYLYKLEICSVHFPITVKIEGDNFVIKNFIGENKDRVLKVLSGVEVEIKGNIIEVTSIDKERAGRMAAEIENITKIRGYDRRIFQDGIWIIKKEKGRKHRKQG